MFALLDAARVQELARFDTHGTSHGFTFHPIEADPKKIIASMNTGIKMDVPDSCGVSPYTGRHTCTGAHTANLSADGFMSDRKPKVTGW